MQFKSCAFYRSYSINFLIFVTIQEQKNVLKHAVYVIVLIFLIQHLPSNNFNFNMYLQYSYIILHLVVTLVSVLTFGFPLSGHKYRSLTYSRCVLTLSCFCLILIIPYFSPWKKNVWFNLTMLFTCICVNFKWMTLFSQTFSKYINDVHGPVIM